jgi:hypothetical protein
VVVNSKESGFCRMMLSVGRLKRVEEIVAREMLGKTIFDYSFREFRKK